MRAFNAARGVSHLGYFAAPLTTMFLRDRMLPGDLGMQFGSGVLQLQAVGGPSMKAPIYADAAQGGARRDACVGTGYHHIMFNDEADPIDKLRDITVAERQAANDARLQFIFAPMGHVLANNIPLLAPLCDILYYQTMYIQGQPGWVETVHQNIAWMREHVSTIWVQVSCNPPADRKRTAKAVLRDIRELLDAQNTARIPDGIAVYCWLTDLDRIAVMEQVVGTFRLMPKEAI